MFDSSTENQFDVSLQTLSNPSNFLGNNSINPLQSDLTQFSSPQQLLTLVGLDTGENQANATQALVNTPTTALVDNAGNTLATARNIGALSSAVSFSDWVGAADTNDYYRFSVGTQSNFSLSLTGLSADADVQLLDSNGSYLSASTFGGSTSESITSVLNAGTYYVRVYPYGTAETNYNLFLNATYVENAGNTLATARNLGTLNSAVSFSDWVGAADTNDYYRFSVGTQSNFNLSLTGLSADADVQLLDSNGSYLSASSFGGSTSESINSVLNAGTYYVRVYPYSTAETNYNLFLNTTTVDNAGNTLATARNIGTLNGAVSFSDWVGAADTNDYYRFSVGTQSNFNLSLTGLSADADVQLLDSNGTYLSASSFGGSTSESITSVLNAGTYYVRVYPYSTAETNYNLFLNTTATSDWYSQNLQDAGIISLTRSLAGDGSLNRNDMISIFRNAEDNNAIDSTELTDLRTIVNNYSRFNMADYVHVLSNKIVNGDVANQYYKSGILGNLYAGSSLTQMENLIDKWFLGGDRPTAPSGFSLTYQQANGSLFGSDGTFNYQDISQGYLGDCYFLSSLGATAFQRPSAIQNMFIDNGDNTFTVRLFGENNGTVTTTDYLTVDRFLPTNVSGNGYTGQRFALYDNANIGIWVALAEKAYAQFSESGSSQRSSTLNSYGTIEGGWGYRAMPSISGVSGGYYSNTNWSNLVSRLGVLPTLAGIASLLSSGKAVTADTISSPGLGIVGGHEYIVTSANTSTGMLTLYNPWGVTRQGETNGIRTISYNDFALYYYGINVV